MSDLAQVFGAALFLIVVAALFQERVRAAARLERDVDRLRRDLKRTGIERDDATEQWHAWHARAMHAETERDQGHTRPRRTLCERVAP